jgi:multisubunit Na+/H+ antiporter MnhG subunit
MELDQRDAPGPEPPRRDKRIYFALMGTCLGLIILAWAVIWHFSLLAAVIMSVVAMVIPPFAAIIANRASAVDRRPPPPPPNTTYHV